MPRPNPSLTPDRIAALRAEGLRLRHAFEKRIAPMKIPDPSTRHLPCK